MTRQLEAAQEERSRRLHEKAGRALESGLASALDRAGAEFLGLGLKHSEYDTLITLRALFPSGKMVCFVGGPDPARTVLKAVDLVERNEAKWREDKF